jgi:hypothetical protein
VESFCRDRDGGCSDSERSTLLTFSYVGGTFGIIVMFILVTLFMRKVFLTICAFERSNQEAQGAQRLYPVVLSLAQYLPNWEAIVSAAIDTATGLWNGLWNGCGRSARQFNCQETFQLIFVVLIAIALFPVTTVFLSDAIHPNGPIFAIVFWIIMLILSLVFCGDNVSSIWCTLALYLEYVLIIVLEALSHSKH